MLGYYQTFISSLLPPTTLVKEREKCFGTSFPPSFITIHVHKCDGRDSLYRTSPFLACNLAPRVSHLPEERRRRWEDLREDERPWERGCLACYFYLFKQLFVIYLSGCIEDVSNSTRHSEFKQHFRAQNNGRSPDNVRPRWQFVRTKFGFGGHFDRSSMRFPNNSLQKIFPLFPENITSEKIKYLNGL